MQLILFFCVFISDGALIWVRCPKFVSGLIIMGMRRLLRWDLGVVPVIIYHFNAEPVVWDNEYAISTNHAVLQKNEKCKLLIDGALPQ